MVRLEQGDRGARHQPGRQASNGETTGRWRPAAIASLAPVMGARKELTGGGAGCQWQARARGDGPLGPRKGGECERARERERRPGLEAA
jgi:hypothetical protein